MASFLPTRASAISEAGQLLSRFKIIEEGWFDKVKKDQISTHWKRRFFNLDMHNKSISYYEDDHKNNLKGVITLTEVVINYRYYN